MRTVAWANGADLAPEFLLELLHRDSGNDTQATRQKAA
jgi:hypothetical protein